MRVKDISSNSGTKPFHVIFQHEICGNRENRLNHGNKKNLGKGEAMSENAPQRISNLYLCGYRRSRRCWLVTNHVLYSANELINHRVFAFILVGDRAKEADYSLPDKSFYLI